jgi:hypothetical protein
MRIVKRIETIVLFRFVKIKGIKKDEIKAKKKINSGVPIFE